MKFRFSPLPPEQDLDKTTLLIPSNTSSVRLMKGLRVYWQQGEKLIMEVAENQLFENQCEFPSPKYVKLYDRGFKEYRYASTIEVFADYEVMIENSYCQAYAAAEAAIRVLNRLHKIRPVNFQFPWTGKPGFDPKFEDLSYKAYR
jgi:hypothetical protein